MSQFGLMAVQGEIAINPDYVEHILDAISDHRFIPLESESNNINFWGDFFGDSGFYIFSVDLLIPHAVSMRLF